MDSQGPLDSHPHGPGSTGAGASVSGSNKRPYEGSSSESVVSFATDSVSVTQNSVLSGSVANSVVGPDGKRPVKSSVSSIGCRQRITVVCAECKRLKLKCDRRTPCGSCAKRDTVAKCIYSQAAAEKMYVPRPPLSSPIHENNLNLTPHTSIPDSSGAVALTLTPVYPVRSRVVVPRLPLLLRTLMYLGDFDRRPTTMMLPPQSEPPRIPRPRRPPRIHRDVQSLNIRLQAVEGKLSGVSLPSDPASSSSAGPSHAQKKSSLPGLVAPFSASTAPAQQRAFLAVGAHGSSVAVNLEGVAGLWVDHLGLSKASVPVRDTPPSIGELDLERLGVRIVRQAGGSGIDLRPSSYPSIPAEGLLQFIEEYTELFRVPASRVMTSETIAGDDRDHDIEHGGEEGEDEAGGQVGVSPKLVYHTFPPAHIRMEIYKRLEQHHFMSPSVNFMVFRNRIEEMCSWAEAELNKAASGSGNENGRRDELLPTTSTMNTSGPPATTSSAVAMATNTMLTTATTAGTLPPTLSFFAAACFGIALGARCWAIEQEVLGRASGPRSFGTDRASSPGPSNLGGSTNFYDPSMPPPPLPLSSFDTGGSTSPASPASGPATSQGESSSALYLDPSLPGKLYRVAKFSLQLATECAGYEVFDTDYIHAKCLQARYLLGSHHGLGEGADLLRDFGAGRRKKVEKRKRKSHLNGETDHGQILDEERPDAVMDDAFVSVAAAAAESPSNNNSPKRKGKEKESARGPALALASEMFSVVGDAVANARMMGLNHDPELTGGGRFSVYEAEMRRRLWWELVIHDAFVAECLGESPFINDDRATTEFPADVDEESFGPDSANRPAPNIESMHGNIEGFIQRFRLVALGKKLNRKLAAFKELHPDAGPAETRELLLSMKAEIARWQDNLSDHLKLKEIPSNAHNIKTSASPSSKRPPSSPPERDNREAEESPHLIAIRCRLAISARHLFMNLCLAVTKDSWPDGTAVSRSKDDYSEKTFDALMMLEPAVYIVRVWRYLHSVYRNEHPALFMCYAFTRELFNAAVVLGHLAIKHPLFAPRALASLRLASETMRDPSVLTSRHRYPHSEENDNLPSEAVRIIEELIMKAEAAEEAANLEFGDLGPTSIGTPSMMKRKHEEVEAASSDLMYHFRFPFVGPSVVSAGPPATTPNPNPVPIPNVALPLANGVANPVASTRNGASSSRTKHGAGTAVDAATAGDPRPATTKLKSSHPQYSIRNRNRKDSSRVRANSTASQRSDASHMLPPSSLSSTHGHGVPPNRLSSVEPSTPMVGPTSYPVPLSTTPGPGPPHYNSPPGTSGGTSSQPPPPPNNGGEFPSGFRDTGNFHGASPASYGPSYPPQSGPSLPVPSQVGFDSFNMESSDQRRDSISLGSGEASSFGFSSANGMDRPGPVGMHQPAGFDSLGGLPRPPSEPPQDRPFPRNLVDSRPHNRDTDDRMGPPIQPLDHQPHSHSHPSLHPPQAYHPPMQQGWNDYSSWPYYP